MTSLAADRARHARKGTLSRLPTPHRAIFAVPANFQSRWDRHSALHVHPAVFLPKTARLSASSVRLAFLARQNPTARPVRSASPEITFRVPVKQLVILVQATRILVRFISSCPVLMQRC